MTECTFCGADVEAHDPVYVSEPDGDATTRVGSFCNYACLSAYIDAEGLETGACCQWEPGE